MDESPVLKSQTPAVAARVYRTEILVRFRDCDPAGIVFYPRYLEMFNNLVEDWLRDEVRLPFSEIINTRGWGLPTVHLEVDFKAPSSFGESLAAEMVVSTLGSSSVTLSIGLRGPDGRERVHGKLVLVLIDAKQNRSMTIPDEIRQCISTFLVAD